MPNWGKCDFQTEEEKIEEKEFESSFIGRIIETAENAPILAFIRSINEIGGYAGTLSSLHFSHLIYGENMEEILKSIDCHSGRYAGNDRIIIISDTCPELSLEDPEEIECCCFDDE